MEILGVFRGVCRSGIPPSPLRQVLGLLRAFRRPVEQPADLDAERFGELVERIDRGREQAAFDLADVRPVDAGVGGEAFLRQSLVGAQLAQVPGEEGAGVHPGSVGMDPAIATGYIPQVCSMTVGSGAMRDLHG